MRAQASTDPRQSQEGPVLGRVPSRLLYRLIQKGTAMLCRLFVHPRIRRDPRLDQVTGPMIVLSNHPSYVDPPLVAMALVKRRINFLTTQVFFRKKLPGWILFTVGAIPKVQFRSDSRAVKAMLRVLGRNGTLSIFPEGQRSLDGTPTPFDDAIAKLVRKTKSTVAIVHISGGYLTWPRWSTNQFRRGRIDVRSELLIPGEEAARLSVEEIHSRIVDALYYQEFDWQRQAQVRFRSKKPAESLHRVLHQCPKCQSELALRSEKDRLFCAKCGNTALMDDYGFLRPVGPQDLVFEDIRAWHVWQLDQQRVTVAMEGFRADYSVRLETAVEEQPYIPFGDGTLTLSETGFDYQGLHEGQAVTRHFALPARGGTNADFGISIELKDAENSCRFFFNQEQEVIQVADRVAALLDKRSVNP